MVNFGLLTAEIGWSVWGTPENFNGFRVGLLWSPHGIGQTIIISFCGLFFLLLLLSFPRLISAAADWMSAILPHTVWP